MKALDLSEALRMEKERGARLQARLSEAGGLLGEARTGCDEPVQIYDEENGCDAWKDCDGSCWGCRTRAFLAKEKP